MQYVDADEVRYAVSEAIELLDKVRDVDLDVSGAKAVLALIDDAKKHLERAANLDAEFADDVCSHDEDFLQRHASEARSTDNEDLIEISGFVLALLEQIEGIGPLNVRHIEEIAIRYTEERHIQSWRAAVRNWINGKSAA